MKNIKFTLNPLKKIETLIKTGLCIKWSIVVNMLESPDRVRPWYGNRKITERTLNKKYMIRIIFSEYDDHIKVIILYLLGFSRNKNVVQRYRRCINHRNFTQDHLLCWET